MPEQDHLTRRPAPAAPLPCFSLEHDGTDPRCKACIHETDCVKAMGSRAERVKLSQLRFNLRPVAQMDNDDPDRKDVIGTYTSCYRQVFKEAPARMTHEEEHHLRTSIREDGMTLRLYILAAMLAFHEGNPDRKFYARQLLGPAAKNNVEMYRRAAANRYGVFDMTTLLSLTGPAEDVIRALTDSEWLAATWVVGYRQKWGQGATTNLYEARELALDPRWLSTERTYSHWLKTSGIPDTDELRRHRHRVTQAGKDDWHFEREKILPSVLLRVLAHHHHRVTDFEAKSPVDQPMIFWAALGDAILQAKCLRLQLSA